MNSRTLLLAFWALCLPSAGQAALIIRVGDAMIQPGGTASLDVTIESGSDVLNAFGFEFQITTAGSSQLAFVNPQTDSQLTNPDYVFFGDSVVQDSPLDFGSVIPTIWPDDTYIGQDLTLSGNDVAVSPSRLLVTLDLTAVTPLPPGSGDEFTVALLVNSFNTFFVNSSGDFLEIDPQSDLEGLVTVNAGGPGVIPEPSTFLLWSLVSGIGLVCQRRRLFSGRLAAQ